jgi:hypothetical protein
MTERRVSDRRKDEGAFNLPTSILVVLVVMATLALVGFFTTL